MTPQPGAAPTSGAPPHRGDGNLCSRHFSRAATISGSHSTGPSVEIARWRGNAVPAWVSEARITFTRCTPSLRPNWEPSP
jgi:hypothetical protein